MRRFTGYTIIISLAYRAAHRTCVSVSGARETVADCVCPGRRDSGTRVSHQQLTAGATQLVVTGAFARASLSLLAYQLRAARKRPERTILLARGKKRGKAAGNTTLERRHFRCRHSFSCLEAVKLGDHFAARLRNEGFISRYWSVLALVSVIISWSLRRL